ncbi:MAG TPA: tetratricopeptide repeat protein [Tepidisphaeraceae bacterium]
MGEAEVSAGEVASRAPAEQAPAESDHRLAITRQHANAEAFQLLGAEFYQQGRFEEALKAFCDASEAAPGEAIYHDNIGCALVKLGRVKEAVEQHREAVRLNPSFAEAHANLGNALVQLGKCDEAVEALRAALQLKLECVSAWVCLGRALLDLRDPTGAGEALAEALRLEPGNAGALNNMARTQEALGRCDLAIHAARGAIQSRPNFPEAYTTLGYLLQRSGRLDDALGCYARAVELRPQDSAVAASNFLYAMNFHEKFDGSAILAAHREWGAQYEPATRAALPHNNDRNPHRRIRVGYVSPDFREHPAGAHLLATLSSHDREQVEVFCYCDATRKDAVTARCEAFADGWRESSRWSHAELCEQVRADQIDLLVDCALHTAGNRLAALAHKPAPVQLSHFGYPGTTGLGAIDYRISDWHLNPPLVKALCSETTLRLANSFWCYEPLVDVPQAHDVACAQSGVVTFGCITSLAKIRPGCLRLTAEVMARVPRSRLVLQRPESVDASWVLKVLGERGIAAGRVMFVPPMPLEMYFKLYDEIDLVMDCFPYNGHNTSLDALYMGTPVLTLAGQTPVGRGGVSILTCIRLEELIAQTPEEYVEKAVALAGDVDRLRGYRRTLRERLRFSALMNPHVATRDLETLYRQAWRAWCESA